MRKLQMALNDQQIILRRNIDNRVVTEMCFLIDQMVQAEVKKAELFINCYGGLVEDALHLCDAITSSGIEFTAVVTANCQSCAVAVLQVCTSRFAYPNATLMVHEVEMEHSTVLHRSKSLEAYQDEIAFKYQRIQDLDTRIKQILCSRLSSDRTLFGSYYVEGNHFSSEVALQIGLIDKIVYPVASKA
jgi:ATP-dependent protease ClpP protease subunit